ncbi:hypothetical protein HDU67_004261 [Dinochytrium kinnereticum]|nr:hypothetical protein HDU67_004261 [Dinochytrium kinnereticum]
MRLDINPVNGARFWALVALFLAILSVVIQADPLPGQAEQDALEAAIKGRIDQAVEAGKINAVKSAERTAVCDGCDEAIQDAKAAGDKKAKSEAVANKPVELAKVDEARKNELSAIGVGITTAGTAAGRKADSEAFVLSDTPELRLKNNLQVGGHKAADTVVSNAGIAGTSEADYTAVRAKLAGYTPAGATLKSIESLDPIVKSADRTTAGRKQGNVLAIYEVNGKDIGVNIHCDLARRSMVELSSRHNPETRRLFRRARALAGSEECKRKHANKVAKNVESFHKGQVKNADGTINVKATLANLKKSNPDAVGRITKASLGSPKAAKKWAPVDTSNKATSKAPKAGAKSPKKKTPAARKGPKAKGAKAAKRSAKKSPAKKGAKRAAKKSPARKAAKKAPARKGAKRAAKKSPARKAAKKAAKKAPARKGAKRAAKKSPARKAAKRAAKKSPARKAAKKAAARKAPKRAAKKAPARKAAKKAPARKAAKRAAKKAPARKAAKRAAKKAPARKAAKKAPARKAPKRAAKKAPARKAAKKAPARKAAPKARAAPKAKKGRK